MAKDPVCGMTIDEEKAAVRSEYQGRTYYFCVLGCKVAFEKDPEKYLQGKFSLVPSPTSHVSRLAQRSAGGGSKSSGQGADV
jgi:YHS domain-containing protein